MGAPVCNEIDITVTAVPDLPVVTARTDKAVEGTATEFVYGFTDPDGHLWEIVWNPQLILAD